jgi:PAS domain S-box-containing protein
MARSRNSPARRRLADEVTRLGTEKDEALGLLDALFAAAPVGLAFWDRELRYVRINAALAEMNGLPVAAHLGQPVTDVLPGLAERLVPLWRRVLATGEPVIEAEVSGETPRAPGVTRHWLASYYPIRGAGGEVVGLGGVVVEVTARRAAEAEHEALLGMVAHDLKTPLTAIRGSAELLLHQARNGRLEPARVARRAEAIGSAAATMTLQIGELLDLARLRSGQPLELVRRPTDLVALVYRVAALAQATTARHTVEVEAAVGHLVAAWDAFRLERVVGNLLANAVKYSPGGGEIRVRVAREPGPDGGWAVLTVEDRGIGIPAEDLPHVFERFRRGRNAVGRIPGEGLGLAGARQIVEQHGGTIAAESAAGRGSTFVVRLPTSPLA